MATTETPTRYTEITWEPVAVYGPYRVRLVDDTTRTAYRIGDYRTLQAARDAAGNFAPYRATLELGTWYYPDHYRPHY